MKTLDKIKTLSNANRQSNIIHIYTINNFQKKMNSEKWHQLEKKKVANTQPYYTQPLTVKVNIFDLQYKTTS